MSVVLTFAMATASSASMRVQTMLMPYGDRFENKWTEDGSRTYFEIRVPRGGVEGFIDDVRACHPTIWYVDDSHDN